MTGGPGSAAAGTRVQMMVGSARGGVSPGEGKGQKQAANRPQGAVPDPALIRKAADHEGRKDGGRGFAGPAIRT